MPGSLDQSRKGSEMIEKIQQVIEDDINPYLAMHSGGCEESGSLAFDGAL